MAYSEFPTLVELADLVTCTWEREVPRAGAPPAQRVVPDGAWTWSGAVRTCSLGPDSGLSMSPLEPGETIVGLRLRPGIAGRALGLPASELRDTRMPLSDVWRRAGAELAARVGEAETPLRRRRVLEAALLHRRSRMDEPDRLVLAAIRELGLPGSRVRSLSEALATSERQLLRRFRAAVGYGPKTLDRVLRFQRFVARAPDVLRGDDGLARVAAELGYVDQSHLTRDCVRLAGVTPTRLLD